MEPLSSFDYHNLNRLADRVSLLSLYDVNVVIVLYSSLLFQKQVLTDILFLYNENKMTNIFEMYNLVFQESEVGCVDKFHNIRLIFNYNLPLIHRIANYLHTKYNSIIIELNNYSMEITI